MDLERTAEALASYDRAIALKADYADAHNNRGTVLNELKRSEEALASYNKAISLQPNNAQAHNNRGSALRDLNRLKEALASHDRAIALKPDFADAHYNRGLILWDQNRFAEALASMDRTLALEPKHFHALAHGALLACMTCNWTAVERVKADFLAQCQVPEFNGAPFPLLVLCDDPAAQRAAAQAYITNRCPQASARRVTPRFGKRNKLRLGYLSADFREHPIAFLIAELIELHDRSRFDVYAFSATASDSGRMRKRLESTFDVFVDVGTMSDGQLDRAIRQSEIDILVDLGRHTTASRIHSLALRPAPLQVTYLGYPGTSGAPFIDYSIVDAFVVPPQEAVHFSEKLAYLPECFQVNDRKRGMAERTPTPAECGLPDSAFVFCAFNSAYKINAAVFDT